MEALPTADGPGVTSAFARLGATPTIAVRQETQAGEVALQALGLDIEFKNMYKIGAAPAGARAKADPDDAGGWAPTSDELTSMAEMMYVKEESSCIIRCLATICGVSNLRPLKLHFTVNPEGHAFIAERPFKCGGGCCSPLVMHMFTATPDGSLSRPIGRVTEDFSPYCGKCMEACCSYTYYTDIETVTSHSPLTFAKRFTVVQNMACCGRHSNFCGGTCFKNDGVFDIIDSKTGQVAGSLQKTYAPGGSGCESAWCRCCHMFSNYVLTFPAESTPEERALLLLAVFDTDYKHFEKTGNENNS